MSNWDMSNLNQPDPHEAVQRYRDARHAHVAGGGHHGPVTLKRIFIWLLVIAGISLLPMMILFLAAARAGS